MINFSIVSGFQWDKGNNTKNMLKHNVSNEEAEQVFFNQPLLLLDDKKHALNEKRYHVKGLTNHKRRLHITFTLREKGTKLRVISARDMHKKEQVIYEKHT